MQASCSLATSPCIHAFNALIQDVHLIHSFNSSIRFTPSGQLFPDNDPQWKGQSSDRFLLEAVRLMEERGYVIGNLDCTIIAEKPKLSPHKVGQSWNAHTRTPVVQEAGGV